MYVETTAIRCPELDAKIKAEAGRRTARPVAVPVKLPDGTSKLGHPPDSIRAWINRLEISEQRKGELLALAVAEYERCRTGRAATPSS